MAVFYVLTTRSSTRPPYTTSMDSTIRRYAGLLEQLLREHQAVTCGRE